MDEKRVRFVGIGVVEGVRLGYSVTDILPEKPDTLLPIRYVPEVENEPMFRFRQEQ